MLGPSWDQPWRSEVVGPSFVGQAELYADNRLFVDSVALEHYSPRKDHSDSSFAEQAFDYKLEQDEAVVESYQLVLDSVAVLVAELALET